MMVLLHLGEESIYRSFQAGVSGIVSLASLPETLLSAIRTVAQGCRYRPDDVSSYLARRLAKPSLTSREYAVLSCIVEGKSNKEIGRNLYIAEGTVKSHINCILNKLEAKDRTQAVLTALREGWISDRMLYIRPALETTFS